MPGPWGHFCSLGLEMCVFYTCCWSCFSSLLPQGEPLSTSPASPVLQIVHVHISLARVPGFVGYLLFSDFFLSDSLGQGQEEALEVSFVFCDL